MAQVNDLSRSLTAFDPISTLVVVVEMSKASWLVSGEANKSGHRHFQNRPIRNPGANLAK